jgi:hypothetical protein
MVSPILLGLLETVKFSVGNFAGRICCENLLGEFAGRICWENLLGPVTFCWEAFVPSKIPSKISKKDSLAQQQQQTATKQRACTNTSSPESKSDDSFLLLAHTTHTLPLECIDDEDYDGAQTAAGSPRSRHLKSNLYGSCLLPTWGLRGCSAPVCFP